MGSFFPWCGPTPTIPVVRLSNRNGNSRKSSTSFARNSNSFAETFRARAMFRGTWGARTSHQSAAKSRRVARELGVGIDLDEHGVRRINYAGPKTTSEEKLASFLKALESMPPGGTYWFFDHPGLDT